MTWRIDRDPARRHGLVDHVDPARAGLDRAAYGGRPGHPVLLGRARRAGVCAAAVGDAGARGYLAGRADVTLVECGDLATPDDVDTPEHLTAFRWKGRKG